MSRTARLRALIPLALFAGLGCLLARSASGDATADRALEAAIERGRVLYEQSWQPGAKSCRACHARGPNQLTSERIASYPKYDKTLKRVVSAQQKLAQMIKAKGQGEPPELGSEDLTALEAYVSSLR